MSIIQNALTNLLPAKKRSETLVTGVSNFLGFSAFGSQKQTLNVTPSKALTLSAFYNGIEILTNDIALPSKSVYKKDGKNREVVSDHPANYLISKRPNQYMTSFMFHKMMAQFAILKGNAYVLIERNKITAAPIAYQLIVQPVKVVVSNAQLYYKVKHKHKTVTYDATDIIHIPGFSLNGITGIGIVTFAAHSLGVSLSAQNYSSEYYQSKGLGSGYIKSDKEINGDAKTEIGNAFSDILSTNDPWKVPVLDEGMSFHPIQITAAEAQFLATSKHGIEEVARWLNIPPHKLKSLSDSNHSITEIGEIIHNQDSVLPWVTKFEQEYDAKIFTEKEKHTHFVKFNMNTLMRADIKSQAEYFSKMVFNGVMDRNEVRALLDMNAKEGLSQPLTPVNTQIMDMVLANLKKIENENKKTA